MGPPFIMQTALSRFGRDEMQLLISQTVIFSQLPLILVFSSFSMNLSIRPSYTCSLSELQTQ